MSLPVASLDVQLGHVADWTELRTTLNNQSLLSKFAPAICFLSGNAPECMTHPALSPCIVTLLSYIPYRRYCHTYPTAVTMDSIATWTHGDSDHDQLITIADVLLEQTAKEYEALARQTVTSTVSHPISGSSDTSPQPLSPSLPSSSSTSGEVGDKRMRDEASSSSSASSDVGGKRMRDEARVKTSDSIAVAEYGQYARAIPYALATIKSHLSEEMLTTMEQHDEWNESDLVPPYRGDSVSHANESDVRRRIDSGSAFLQRVQTGTLRQLARVHIQMAHCSSTAADC